MMIAELDALTCPDVEHSDNRGASKSHLAFLSQLGLLDERDIVDGDVKVVNVSRRNQNFRVTASGKGKSSGYFVKQALGEGCSRMIGLEAAFLSFAASSACDDRLLAHLPKVRAWEADHGLLVCDLIPEAHSLAERQRRTRRFSSTLAGRVGGALAALHDWQPATTDQSGFPIVDSGPPWILSIHRPDLGILDRLSAAGLEVVKIVQSSETILEALDQLRSSWQAGAIIHGDLKPDNVVVSRRIPERRAYDVVLVDWEMVQIGDPLWDVASFSSQYLDAWIASIPVVDDSSLAASPRPLVPLERVQPAMTRFWSAYGRGRIAGREQPASPLERVARYAAARLIQTAIEAEQHSSQLSNPSVLRLQVAENMLRRPAAAVASLFGVDG